MTGTLLLYTAFWLSAASAPADKPTREAIRAYTAACKQQQQRVDLVAKFGTDFRGLDLSGVDFRGPYAVGKEPNLRRADFSGARLIGAEFGNAVLEGADFTGADLTDAVFVTANMRSVRLRNASLNGTKIHESNLAGADLAGVDLSQADITGSAFPAAVLSGTRLAGARSEYWGRDFAGANLSGADLRGLTLQQAQFRDAILRSANLSGCDLQEADFTNADLAGAVFSDANLSAADFRKARGLSDAEQSRLMTQARRGPFELRRDITRFLDSPWFPVWLLLLVPAAAAVTGVPGRWLRRRSAEPVSRSGFQFGISTLLLVTLLACIFLGIGVHSTFGAFWFTMVCAGYMMLGELLLGRSQRWLAVAMFGTALLYAALNAGLYAVVLMHSHPFSIFDPFFMLSAIVLAPGAVIIGSFVAAVRGSRLPASFPSLGITGLTLWMIGVGAANLWVIAEASAAV